LELTATAGFRDLRHLPQLGIALCRPLGVYRRGAGYASNQLSEMRWHASGPPHSVVQAFEPISCIVLVDRHHTAAHKHAKHVSGSRIVPIASGKSGSVLQHLFVSMIGEIALRLAVGLSGAGLSPSAHSASRGTTRNHYHFGHSQDLAPCQQVSHIMLCRSLVLVLSAYLARSHGLVLSAQMARSHRVVPS
jgi:hypothetical protein